MPAMTQQDKAERKILATLADLGKITVSDDALVFEGTRFILPESMAGDIGAAMRYLRDWRDQQETKTSFSKVFNYRPMDGAAAFERAMTRVFGTAGIGKATFSFFGVEPPESRNVPSGPNGETIQVPWGDVEFSPLKATFTLAATSRKEHGRVFALLAEAPKKYKAHIEGFFKVVEDELRHRSLYKGKAITADPIEPTFIDTANVDPAKVVYTDDVTRQLEVNVWSPLRYSAEMRKAGVPLKRAVLFEGPNGTGKTLGGALTAQIAVDNGWTFIWVRPTDDPFTALQTAQMYAPAVLLMEDIDVIASAEGRARHEISKVLDALDNVQNKNREVMAVFTSNFADKLDKGVLRPGRLDAVIHVGELDATGNERLVHALLPDGLLAHDVDFARVSAAFEGFLPAFATEATQRAVRYSIARNHGRPDAITTGDLVDAANGMRDHLALMANAEHGKPQNTVDAAFARMAEGAAQRALAETTGYMEKDPSGPGYSIEFETANGKH